MKGLRRLRGRGAFPRVRYSGGRIKGDLVSCFFLSEVSEAATLDVGFGVAGGRTIAVQRNRIRRLMKEAFRMECSILFSHVESLKRRGVLLLVFNSKKNLPLYQIGFRELHRDIAKLIRVLTLKL